MPAYLFFLLAEDFAIAGSHPGFHDVQMRLRRDLKLNNILDKSKRVEVFVIEI